MAIKIVQLGSPRKRGEGVRLGTVRRPPRGVRTARYSKDDWFDVWFPNLAPTAALMRRTTIQEDGTGFATFARRYEAELKRPEASRTLDVLAMLSRNANFSVGCYCSQERVCHRSVLRRLLRQRGALVR